MEKAAAGHVTASTRSGSALSRAAEALFLCEGAEQIVRSEQSGKAEEEGRGANETPEAWRPASPAAGVTINEGWANELAVHVLTKAVQIENAPGAGSAIDRCLLPANSRRARQVCAVRRANTCLDQWFQFTADTVKTALKKAGVAAESVENGAETKGFAAAEPSGKR